MARKRVLTRQQQHDVRTPRIGVGIGIGIGIGSSRDKTVDRDDDDDDGEPSSWFASSDGSTTTRIRSRCSVSNRRGLPFSFPSRCCFWCSANANANTNANATNNGTPSMSMSMLQRRPRRHRATDGFGSATATLSATRIVGGAAIVVFVSLVLPKWIFAAGRNLLMSRPAVLYGTPTDWNDVAGCLSRTHRREVRDHYRAVNGGKNDNNNNNNNNGGNRENLSARIPLNPNVRWNWSRYSSSSLGDDGDSDSASNKKKKKKEKKTHNHQDDTTSMMPRRRLLIAQYSGKGSYERLLREVEPINRAYARKWGHDYTTLIGTALKFPGLLYDPPPQPPLLGETDRGATANERNNGKNKTGTIERRHGEKRKRQQQQQQQQRCRYFHSPKNGTDSQSQSQSQLQSQSSYYEYEAQSTFNKIPLLFKAMDESPRRYDQVLILDADTMIVDFDYDITTLLLSSNPTGNGDDSDSDNDSDNDANIKSRTNHDRDETNDDASAPYFLAAYRVWQFDWISTWDVNAGITLWDLHHPSTRAVAEDWLRLSLGDPKQVLLKNDDQYYLQRSLQRVKKQKRRRDQKHQQRRRQQQQQQQQRRDNAAPLGSGTETTNGVRSLLVLGTKTFRNWWKKHTILPAILGFLYDSRRALPQTKAKTKTTTSDDKAYNEYEYDDGVGILAIRDEFDYYDATVVKHFKRDTASWSRTGLEQRVLRIREAKAELCQKWPGECTAEGLS
eukprot:jgi/Psemu1/37762/gm1.37762_g